MLALLATILADAISASRVRAAVERERASVVRYLRESDSAGPAAWITLGTAADEIASGLHVREEG